MGKSEFDPAEMIGGFSLVAIKRVLGHVGLLDDRDDIENVASSLGCPRSQAERVLAALERRGMVTKTAKSNQWDSTDLGRRLAWHWKAPPKLEPVIALEPESDAINEMFESVPCSILRYVNDEDAFEEADLQVGVFVEYASPRVIEISVLIPDDYDCRDDGGGTYDSSVYVSVEDAKRFAAALQTAIERAETEIARRATAKPRVKEKKLDAPPIAETSSSEPKKGVDASASASELSAESGVASKAKRTKTEQHDDKRRRRDEKALAATLKELGSPSKTRTRDRGP
jgi:hypothetical protein